MSSQILRSSTVQTATRAEFVLDTLRHVEELVIGESPCMECSKRPAFMTNFSKKISALSCTNKYLIGSLFLYHSFKRRSARPDEPCGSAMTLLTFCMCLSSMFWVKLDLPCTQGPPRAAIVFHSYLATSSLMIRMTVFTFVWFSATDNKDTSIN